ncbi:MAG TPA: hypothetical protein VIS74_07630 [Chthoniobacterales bacterium]
MIGYEATANAEPLSSLDIGATGVAGSVSESGGVYTIKGSGADIWGSSDQFYFLYQKMQGDFEVVARVQSIANTNTWAKAGLMMRETLNANSKNAFSMVSPGGTRFQARAQTGGSSVTSGNGTTAPKWIRLVRAGNVFTGYFSSDDGTTWVQSGSATISMAQTIYVGLAVTSHVNSVLTTAVIDQVDLPGQSGTLIQLGMAGEISAPAFTERGSDR